MRAPISLNSHKIRSLLSQSPEKRFEYFIKQVADLQILWLLHDSDGICMFGDAEGRECIPVWPNKEFALANANGEWREYKANSIDLNVWLNEALPDLQDQRKLIAIFPSSNLSCVIISPLLLKEKIQEELKKIE